MLAQKERLKHFYQKSDGRNQYRLVIRPVFCTHGKCIFRAHYLECTFERQIRHTTTLKLNEEFLDRHKIDFETLEETNSESLFVGSVPFRD